MKSRSEQQHPNYLLCLLWPFQIFPDSLMRGPKMNPDAITLSKSQIHRGLGFSYLATQPMLEAEEPVYSGTRFTSQSLKRLCYAIPTSINR